MRRIQCSKGESRRYWRSLKKAWTKTSWQMSSSSAALPAKRAATAKTRPLWRAASSAKALLSPASVASTSCSSGIELFAETLALEYPSQVKSERSSWEEGEEQGKAVGEKEKRVPR